MLLPPLAVKTQMRPDARPYKRYDAEIEEKR